jgi:peroxiredoxin
MKPIPVLAILALFIANTNFLNANTAEEVRPLLIGAKIPSVEVTNQQGEPIDLLNVLQGRSSVVIFYRGSWCPYCNTQLSELASIEDDLKKSGYQIIAISPDKPESLDITDAKLNLGYQLISDSDYRAMDAFGVSYENKRRGKLPVPSVFLVTPELEISFQYVNPNYKYRISSDLLLAAAKSKEH